MAFGLDQFAKSLARHVDVDEHLTTGALPSVETAVEPRDVGVAKLAQTGLGALHQSAAIIVEYDGCVEARDEIEHFKLDPAERQRHREQGMTARVGPFFAHFDQGGANGRGGDNAGHGGSSLRELAGSYQWAGSAPGAIPSD